MEPQQKTINPNLYTPIAIVIAGVIIGAAVLWINTSRPVAQDAQAPATPAVAADVSKVNAVGQPSVGKADAPVTIAYWFDYQCPFCKQYEENSMTQIMKDYVDTGKVRIVYKDFSFLGSDSDTLGHAAQAVWEVAPTKFAAWHKAVFDNQGQENSGWATKAKILSFTTDVLGAADATRVIQLMQTKAKQYQTGMDTDRAEGASFGINGTPSMIIGKQLIQGAESYATIKAAIETALRSK